MTVQTWDEYILDLYARYRKSGWRFRRVSYYDGAWGITFVCAGKRVRIWAEHGRVLGDITTGERVTRSVDIGLDGDMPPQAYETMYRRLDKKAGVTRGK